MKSRPEIYVAVCVSVASVLALCSPAAGFNPQPEPPGKPGNWYVEGFMDLTVDAVDPTGEDTPFGIDENIAGDADVDFSAGVIAWFDAASTADDKPVDGSYDVLLEYFDLRIGDTTWDLSLIHI